MAEPQQTPLEESTLTIVSTSEETPSYEVELIQHRTHIRRLDVEVSSSDEGFDIVEVPEQSPLETVVAEKTTAKEDVTKSTDFVDDFEVVQTEMLEVSEVTKEVEAEQTSEEIQMKEYQTEIEICNGKNGASCRQRRTYRGINCRSTKIREGTCISQNVWQNMCSAISASSISGVGSASR